MIGIVLGEFFISDFRDEAAGSSDSDVDCHFRARASLPRLPEAVMADSSESNPTYLIIGIIVTLVLVFFVGNIWACVFPPGSLGTRTPSMAKCEI